jgi:hypothetical protein
VAMSLMIESPDGVVSEFEEHKLIAMDIPPLDAWTEILRSRPAAIC